MASSAYHLKPAEIRKLFIAAPNFRDRCILKSLYWLGLRRQELIDLDVRDIDFDRKRVQVREGKGGKTRIIPIIDEEFLSDLMSVAQLVFLVCKVTVIVRQQFADSWPLFLSRNTGQAGAYPIPKNKAAACPDNSEGSPQFGLQLSPPTLPAFQRG